MAGIDFNLAGAVKKQVESAVGAPGGPPLGPPSSMGRGLYAPATGKVKLIGKSSKKPAAPIKLVAAKTIAGNASTIAGKVAVSQAAAPVVPVDSSNQQLVASAEHVADSRSTKLGVAAGLLGAAVGTGGALLAGLSATIAAPVGIGFGVGSGIVTKLLTRQK